MHTCKICERQFENNFARHLKVHYKNNPLGKLAYFDEFYKQELDIVHEYTVNEVSAAKLGLMVSKIAPFPVQKNDILNFLKVKNIERRNTSDAVKSWSKNRGGPWNKGQTKDTHPSIMSYAMSRLGKNNPIFSLTEKERREKICYWLFKPEDECEVIKNKIRKTLRRKYASGEILHVSVSNPEKHAKIMKAWKEGWKKAYENGLIKRQDYSSSYEKRIALIFENLDIQFVQQKSIDQKFRYDFYVPHKNLIIEFNGDYWHCHPALFSWDQIHPQKKLKAYEIWEYDALKAEHARNCGYNFCVIWENEVVNLKDQELEDYICEIIENF